MEQFWNKLQSWFNEFLVQPSPNSTDASMSFLSSPGPNSRDFGVTRLLSFQKWCLHPSKEKKKYVYKSADDSSLHNNTSTVTPWAFLPMLNWSEIRADTLLHNSTLQFAKLQSCGRMDRILSYENNENKCIIVSGQHHYPSSIICDHTYSMSASGAKTSTTGKRDSNHSDQ